MADPRYWDRIAAKYIARPVADPAAYAHKLAATRARLRPGWTLLELGCGSGATALAHAPHVAHVHATDISAPMLAHARAAAARDGVGNISFEQIGLDQIGAEPRYDAVLMLSLIHLLPDWRAGIARAWALTRPGGIFVSSTACLGGRGPWLPLLIRAARLLGQAPEVAVFTPDALRAAILAQGFAIEEDWRASPTDALFLIARRPGA